MKTINEIENELANTLLSRVYRNRYGTNIDEKLTKIKECLTELQHHKIYATKEYVRNLIRAEMDNSINPDILRTLDMRINDFYKFQNNIIKAFALIRMSGFSLSYGRYSWRHYTTIKTNKETTIYDAHDDDTIQVNEPITAILPAWVINELDIHHALIRMSDKANRHMAYLSRIWQNNAQIDDITDEFIAKVL